MLRPRSSGSLAQDNAAAPPAQSTEATLPASALFFWNFSIFAILGMIVAAALILKYMYRTIITPFAVIFGILFISALLLSRHVRAAKSFVYNLAFVFLALTMAEIYFGFNQPNGNPYPFVVPDKDLGYTSMPGNFHGYKTYRFGTFNIYDVQYSIGSNGLRISRSDAKGPPIFFFCDSFTFGDGVNDDETLPSAFSAASGMRSVNFGRTGYGPHQMLRMLELDIPTKIEPESPRLLVYTAIPDHIKRASGHFRWDQDGPFYQVSNGRPEFAGKLRDHGRSYNWRSWAGLFTIKILNKSRIFQAWHLDSWYSLDSNDPEVVGQDRDRFLAIVKRADEITAEKYSSRLIVLLWDILGAEMSSFEQKAPWFEQDATWIEENLRKNGILVLRLSKVVKEPEFVHWFIPRDGHPDRRAYRYVAQKLLAFIQHVRSSCVRLNPRSQCDAYPMVTRPSR